MNQDQIEISELEEGKRLDQIIGQQWSQYSRSFLQGLIEDGKISVNGNAVKKSHRLHTGDVIHAIFPETQSLETLPEEVDLDFIYKDSSMLVINKPPDMVVHPGAGTPDGTIVNALLGFDYDRFKAMLDHEQRPGIVHRLDKDTSGVLVVGRNDHATAALSQSFAERNTEKIYLAIIEGELPRGMIKVENHIGRHPVNRKRMAVVEKNGKLAISKFKTIARSGRYSLVKIKIETGRTHQIRVHFQALKCSILGDTIYGRRSAQSLAERQMLHAWKLAVPHPEHGGIMSFLAPPPEDFLETMKKYDFDSSLLDD